MRTRIALSAALLSALVGAPAAAQQVAPFPQHLNAGESLGSRTLGYRAGLINPALLASGGFSFTFLGVTAQGGTSPFGPAHLSHYGEMLEENEKAELLDMIRENGGARVKSGVAVHLLGLSVQGAALNVVTEGWGQGTLSPELAELVLYGNVGQSGTATALRGSGSQFRGGAATHASLSYGRTLPLNVPGSVSLGGTLRASLYHAAVDGYDTGSEVRSPLALDLQGDAILANGGKGFGVDLGAAWESPVARFGMTLRNAYQGSHFDASGVELYRMRVFASMDTSYAQTDTVAYAALSASEQAQVEERLVSVRAPREIAVSASRDFALGSVGAEFRKGLGDSPSSVALNQTELSLGGRLRPVRPLSVSAGVGLGDQAHRLSGGMGLHLGSFNLDVAASYGLGEAPHWGVGIATSIGRF